jgi:hypothetical protein
MSADIVNLRHARKRKSRTDREREAAGNRTRFGRSRAERQREAQARKHLERALDGHRRERGDD